MRTPRLPRIAPLLYSALVFLFSIAVFAQTIVVCPKCGYEADSGARFCSHCGARIESAEPSPTAAIPEPADTVPDMKPAAPPSAPATTQADAGADDAIGPATATATAVREDVALARTAMTASSGAVPAAALAALINARALIAISPPGTIEESLRTLALRGLVAAREAIPRVRTTCPRCHGKGREDVIRGFAALDGSRTPLVAGKRTCPLCSGTGSILRLRKMAEINSLLASGRQAFGDQALIQGRVRVGNAWIPPTVQTHLSVRQEATLRHFTADPCPDCAGFGKTDCAACDNTGFVACTAEGCENGMIQPSAPPRGNARERRIESSRLVNPRTCPVCRGTGLTTCTDCAGTGSIVCERCNGSGERSICSRCKGEGVQPCRSCRGTGRDRDGNPCATCSGGGVVRCSSCGGDGYGR